MIDKDKVLPILELYKCVQTEGSMNGRPNFLLRTTGCTHRCFFGAGGWCDSWYTSIHPEKGQYTLNDVERLFEENLHIRSLMISGGSPTMHPELVNEVVNLAKEYDLFITLETEGSHPLLTDHKIDLISLSPKFENSIPQLGIETPMGKVVDQKFIDQHNKFRLNDEAIVQLITYHKDYHFKPVVDRNQPIWENIERFQARHNIPNDKVWIMPAGSTREELIPNYSYVMDECVERGYNFTGRAHIIAFDDQRLK